MKVIRTVNGDKIPDFEGIILPHEHIIIDGYTSYYGKDEAYSDKEDLPLVMENLGALKRNPALSKENMILNDIDIAIEEVGYFKKNAGSCICDMTPHVIGKNPEMLKTLSDITDINIVASTGFYVPSSYDDNFKKRSVSELTDEMIMEITEGFPGTNIRAGIIGEVGTDGDMSDFEKKSLEASAIAQKKTGASILLHSPCPNQIRQSRLSLNWIERVTRILNYLGEKDADLTRVVVGHVDVTMDQNIQQYQEIMRFGSYCLFDNFQQERPGDFENTYAANDMMRVRNIKALVDKGYEKQILISNDVWLRIMLKKYGGWGYSHIGENIIPMMDRNSIPENIINLITNENPKRILSMDV